MRCFICNSVLDAPTYNRDHKDYDPCPTCLEIIADVFSDEDSPFDEVEIADEDVELLLYDTDREDRRFDVV